MTTKQLLDKWQKLDEADRQKVLEFVETIYRQKQAPKGVSRLGKQLREIREEIIKSGVSLLSIEEVEKEKGH
ncbi:MAG: hypothetical protein Fur0025_12530 [Oscillatoriaceae cyanobacterium]